MRSAVAPEKRARANDIPAKLVAVYNKCGKSDLPYRRELLLKERIWEHFFF